MWRRWCRWRAATSSPRASASCTASRVPKYASGAEFKYVSENVDKDTAVRITVHTVEGLQAFLDYGEALHSILSTNRC